MTTVFPEKYWKKLAIGAGIAFLFSAIVFVSAYQFTNPSYAFYSSLTALVAGLLLLPIALRA